MRRTCVAAALACATAWASLAAQQAALDYPQWRGPERDGSAAGLVPPRAWPMALTRRWRVEVGEGYSTPLVMGATLYVFSRRDGEETVSTLDVTTGALRWRTSYGAPYAPSEAAAAHGAGPKATPVLHDGRLFTMGISGIVTAFDATDGRLLWQTPPPKEAAFYGAAASPLAEGDLVVTHPGDYEPLTAFDVRTGEVRWTAGPGGFFASPIAVTLDGVRQVVTATQASIIGVALDGRVLWSYPWNGGREGSTTPVVAAGLVIVGNPRTGFEAVRPRLRDGQWSVTSSWTAPDITSYISDAVAVGATLFGHSTKARGQFFALDLESGRTLWLGPPRASEHTAIVKSGEWVFLLNDDAQLVVARASRDGFEPVARYTVAESATWAQPAMSGNRVFIKDVTGIALWTWE